MHIICGHKKYFCYFYFIFFLLLYYILVYTRHPIWIVITYINHHFLSNYCEYFCQFFIANLHHSRTHTHIRVLNWTITPSLLFLLPFFTCPIFFLDRKIEIVTAAYRERIDLSSFFCVLAWPLNPFLQEELTCLRISGHRRAYHTWRI